MKRRALVWVAFSILVLSSRPVTAGFTSGVVYATATDLNQVIQVNPDGSWSAALSTLANPWGLAFRNQDELYVTGTGPNWPSPSGQMIGYQSNGSVFLTVPNVPVTNQWPNGSEGAGLAIDSQGNAYIATWNTPGATMLTNNGIVSDWTGYQYGLWWGRAAALSPSGELYMVTGLDYGSNPASSVAMINTVTGGVNYLFSQNVPLLDGIAFDKQGNMYLSEFNNNQIVEVAAGTTTITPFATLKYASQLAIGPDGRLYAISDPLTAGLGSSDQIWSFNLTTGQGSLYAGNLPEISDIAFAPGAGAPNYSGPPIAIEGGSSVPEPASVLMLIVGLPACLLLVSRRKSSIES